MSDVTTRILSDSDTSFTPKQIKRLQAYEKGCGILLTYMGKDMPKMGNTSAGRLVDQVGSLKVLEKDTKQIIGLLNGIIDTKLTPQEKAGDRVVQGESHQMRFVPVTQNRFDQQLAIAKITELVDMINKADSERMSILVAADVIASCYKELEMNQHKYDDL